ncbi:MAG: hypothetical protein HY719_16865 [Planctomycetes bacterium]|nr:hypothetical protein [Planctomycetota bacterium]
MLGDLFARLSPYQARRFVPPEFQPDDWPQVERLLDRLEATVADPASNLRDYLLAGGASPPMLVLVSRFDPNSASALFCLHEEGRLR